LKLLLSLFLVGALWAPGHADAAEAALSPTATVDALPVTPAAMVKAETPSAVPVDRRLALGLGYPDFRIRYDFPQVTVEAQAAFLQGVQTYAGRLSFGLADWGPVRARLGAEAGWIKFDGVQTVSGTGGYGQALVGLELPFLDRWSLEAEGGPAWVQLNGDSQSAFGADLVFDAALYFYL